MCRCLGIDEKSLLNASPTSKESPVDVWWEFRAAAAIDMSGNQAICYVDVKRRQTNSQSKCLWSSREAWPPLWSSWLEWLWKDHLDGEEP